MPIGDRPDMPAGDSGEALGLPPSRLTVTFGFGAGLFSKDGADRYGIGSRRPDALVDMPSFNGDQLVEAHTGGDLSIQACADDAQVAFHAVRQLVRLAYGITQMRWVQAGFIADGAAGETPRNLMGFKDGTKNPNLDFSNASGSWRRTVPLSGNFRGAWNRVGRLPSEVRVAGEW